MQRFIFIIIAILVSTALVMALVTTVVVTVSYKSLVKSAKVSVEVAVEEGSVAFYEIDPKNGNNKLIRLLNPGERAVLSKVVREGMDTLNFLRPVLPAVSRRISDKLSAFSGDFPERLFEYVYTEEALNSEFFPGVEKETLLRNIKMTIDETGFSGTAVINAGPLKINIAQAFIINVIGDGQAFDTKISKLTIGGIHITGFILKQLEDSINEVIRQSTATIKILRLKYDKGRLTLFFKQPEK
ncbi:MAG: hypothetical protein HQL30_11575 [Candidatus Omnitrophica bacterium]|nr:hypothetical protein [Candidatus Omnitrophota bacterium]